MPTSIEKARELEKKISTSASLPKLKPTTMWITTNRKILKEMGTCLLRNLYLDQEATVRTRHGTIELVQNWEMSMLRLPIVTLLI